MTDEEILPTREFPNCSLYVGKIVIVEKLGNSLSGNPSFKLTFITHADQKYHTWYTSLDSDFNWDIDNWFTKKQWLFIHVKNKSKIIEMLEPLPDDTHPPYYSYDTTYGEMESPIGSTDQGSIREIVVDILENLTINSIRGVIPDTYLTVDRLLIRLYERGYMIKEI